MEDNSKNDSVSLELFPSNVNDIATKADDKKVRKKNKNKNLFVTLKEKNALRRIKCARKALWSHVQDYLESTSIHGYQYIGEQKRPLLERSFCFEYYMILNVWKKWENSPVIVSMSESSTPVWDIPFPAVTICPENKLRQKLFNFTEIGEKDGNNRTEEEQGAYNQLSLLRDLPPKYRDMLNVTDEINFQNRNYIEEYAPKLEDIMYMCDWNLEDCIKDFHPVLTDEGICYTFNSLNSEDMFQNAMSFEGKYFNMSKSTNWTIESGFPKDLHPYDSYPFRAIKHGSKSGLDIYLKMDLKDTDFEFRFPVEGFKVFIHNCAEFPGVGSQFIRVPLQKDVSVVVDATIMKTSDEVKNYPVKTRRCYFSNDRQLKYFKIYTQKNCEAECFVNITREYGHCIPFYWPNDENFTICGRGNPIYKYLDTDLLGEYIENECGCYAGCSEIKYYTETSQSSLVFPEAHKYGPDNNISSKSFGRLIIYFKDMQLFTSRRNELFGITDLMANCGGLLGLCCGFSLLSAVELIYFFTVRPCSNAWFKHRKNKNNTTNKLSV